MQASVEASGIHTTLRQPPKETNFNAQRSPCSPQRLSVESGGRLTSSAVESAAKWRSHEDTLDGPQRRAKPFLLRCIAASHTGPMEPAAASNAECQEQEHALAQAGITVELEASERNESSKSWVVTAWEHFVMHMVEDKYNYVLRRCWNANEKGKMMVKSSLRKRRHNADIVAAAWGTQSAQTAWHRLGKSHSMDVLEKLQTSTRASWDRLARCTQCMIHPDSLRRVVWSMIGMIFLVLDILYLTMSPFDFGRSRWLDIIDGIYWTLDVVCCFRTGTYVNGEVNLSARNSTRAYVRGWFTFDIILLVYQWVVIGLESRAAKESSFIRYTRLARVMKLLRLTKLRMMFSQVLQRVDDIYVLLALRLVLYTVGLASYVHVSAAIWYTIGRSRPTGWVQQYDGIFQTWPLSYIGSFHWAVTQMQGSPEIMPGNLVERAASSLHYMCSIIVLALFISKLTTVLQQMAEIKAEEQKLVKVAYDFMKQNGIRVDLRIQLQNFLTNEARMRKKATSQPQQSQLLDILPPGLRRALLMDIRMPVVDKGLLMRSLFLFDALFVEKVICMMTEIVHSPGERVFQQGVMCNRVYILQAGVGWYLECSPWFLHVKEALNKQSSQSWTAWHAAYWNKTAYHVEEVGTMMCEGALFVHWIHLGELEADPNKGLSFLVLVVDAFEELVATFTEVQKGLSIHAARVRAYLAKHTQITITDLFRSESVMAA